MKVTLYRLAAASLCVLALACATPPVAPAISGRWVVREIDGAATISGRPPWISFTQDGQIVGAAACNSFSGPYEREGEEITVPDELTSTVVACRIPGVDMQRHYAEGRQLFEVLHAGPLRIEMTRRELFLTTREGRALRLARPN